MENIFVEFLPPWVETGIQPAFYDKESGTVLQQTARMYARVNMLIRMFNKLSKETKETVENYIEQFNQLHTYVHDYFDNLDVQAEIDHKLDEMVEQGTLQEIIAEYLNSKALFGFDSVADMASATNLIDGSYAETLGYRSKNDGGGGVYKIRQITNDDVVDGGSIIEMDDINLIAELIDDGTVSPNQFGAYGDGTHNDLPYLEACRDYAISKHIEMIGYPSSIYGVNDGFTLYSGCDYDFKNATFKALTTMTYVVRQHKELNFEVDPVYIEYTKNLTIDCDNKADYGFYQDVLGWSALVENIRVISPKLIGIYIYQGQVRLYHAKVEQMDFTKSCVGLQIDTSDCEVANLVTRNCTTGVKLTGSANSLSECHPVMFHGIIEGSIGFDLSAHNNLVNCYADTFQYGIKVHHLTGLNAENFRCYVNTYYYNTDTVSTAPYVIYFDTTNNTDASGKVNITGTTIDLFAVYDGQWFNFSNVTRWAGSSIRLNNPYLNNNNLTLPQEIRQLTTMASLSTYLSNEVTSCSNALATINGNTIALNVNGLVLPAINAETTTKIFTGLPDKYKPINTMQNNIVTNHGVSCTLLYQTNNQISFIPHGNITAGDTINFYNLFIM